MDVFEAEKIAENISNFMMDKLWAEKEVDSEDLASDLNVKLAKEYIMGPISEPAVVNDEAIVAFLNTLNKKGVVEKKGSIWGLTSPTRDCLTLFFDIADKFNAAEEVLVKAISGE